MSNDIRLASVVCLCVALSGCGGAGGDEFKKFEGVWVVTECRMDADELSAQIGQEYTFARGKMTIRKGDRVLDTSRVELNPSANPKAVDLISDALQRGEPPAKFLYEFNGDTLRLCRGGIERPNSFTDKEVIVFTLKRKNQ